MLKKISPYFWIILLAAALLPYLAGLNGELVFDDVALIKDDPFTWRKAIPYSAGTGPSGRLNIPRGYIGR